MRGVGARGFVPAARPLVTGTERTALIRLAAIAAAWALGESIAWGLRAPGLDLVLPAAFAVAAYVATRDLGWPSAMGGPAQYWRGRRIDERDRWRH